jgi:hypothetical protein
VHNPAKNDVFICSAVEKAVQQIADVTYDHDLRFFCYLKGVSIPTPVPIKKNAVRQILFQLLAYSRFADTHRSANQI